MSVVDLTMRLRAKRSADLARQRPDRDPDFELHGWLKDGEVEWTFLGCTEEGAAVLDTHQRQVAACIDAAWSIAESTTENDGPAIWVQLDQQGHTTILWPRDLVTGTNWRHSWWLVKQWWRLTRRWWRLAGRALRGRG